MKKKFTVFCICLFIISSCAKQTTDNTDSLKQEIINADISMSDLAVREGFYRALSQYASDEFVKFGEGKFPIVGRKEFDDHYKENPGSKTLTWKSVKAEVAISGELGYTWGNWKMELKDTNYYGNYFTVWKKQNDGSWKMALDGGNSTPPQDNK